MYTNDSHPNITILLVDDDVVFSTITEAQLKQKGYEVITALDGVDVLKLLDGNQCKPDVIVSDNEMPNMGGIELANTLKGEIPFLLWSGIDGKKLEELKKSVVHVNYVLKKFNGGEHNMDELSLRIDYMFRR